MLRTISIGSSILIQGLFVKMLGNGMMRVMVDDRHYDGRPIEAQRA